MQEKRLDFELLRLLAIFGVVFNHTQLRGFELYQLSSGGLNYWASLVLGILCKMAVPLFLLVSGGLLLHREEALSQVLKKRAGRMLAALVLFSLVLYLFWTAWGWVEAPGAGDFLFRLFHEGISAPYWYLYAYLGLMLMLPLLRPMVQHMPDRAFHYLLVLHLVVWGVLGALGSLLDWGTPNEDLLLPLIEPTLFYFLTGYYLAHRLDLSRLRGKMGLLWIASGLAVLLTLLLSHLEIRREGVPGEYLRFLTAVPILTLYISVARLFEGRRPPKWAETVLTQLGGCVFGTYLLEGILRHYLSPVYEALEPGIHVLPACLIWVFAVVLCGLGITWVLKKLPLLRKLL